MIIEVLSEDTGDLGKIINGMQNILGKNECDI